MKRFILLICFFCFRIILAAQDLPGTWQGQVLFRGADVRIVFSFKQEEDKSYSATMNIPLQGKQQDTADEVEISGDSINIEIYSTNVSYAGVFNKDSLAFIGKFEQNGIRLPLKLVKGEAEDLLYYRPQKPLKPFPYLEEEVTLKNKKAGIVLSGTLTKPDKKGKFPAVILISGSGPQDRDETIMAHKPFLLISDYLTRKGYAVLRCDDRGTNESAGDFSIATSADFTSDAEAEFEYLKSRNDIDAKRIGLLGHSEGGVIAPMLAASNKDVAFVILLAAPAINLFDLLLIQDSLVATADGMSEEKVREVVSKNQRLFEIMRATKDSASAADSMDYFLTEKKTPEQEINLTLKFFGSRWMRWFLDYDPKENLRKVQCPVLAINGEKDVQVPAEINISTIENVLRKNGNKNFETAILPGMNHMFQVCKKCSVSEYVQIDETMNQAALDKIGEWLDKNVPVNK